MIPSVTTAQRIVIKIGSALVVDDKTAAPRAAWLDSIAADIASLRARGTEVIVVSSGAIALARRTLKLTHKKLKLEEKLGREVDVLTPDSISPRINEIIQKEKIQIL